MHNKDLFEKRWTEKVNEIKKMSLSTNQSYQVFENFRLDLINSLMYNKINFYDIIPIIIDLKLALFQANNNYKKEFPSFWNNFSQLKLPDIDINNIKVGK